MLDRHYLFNARLNAKVTQKEVAKEMGVTPNYISNIERGADKLSAETSDRIITAIYIAKNRKLINKGKENKVEEVVKEVKKSTKKKTEGKENE